MDQDVWPELPQESGVTAAQTLQMWLQIVGKIRLALTPRIEP